MTGIPRSTYGSRGVAGYRYHTLVRALGADHPAARAALGRLWYHTGRVPRVGLASVEAVAWFRESGAIRGYWNRSERRAKINKERS